MTDLMKRTNITGLSVEMLKHLLDKLHSSPIKLHLNAALSNVDGEILTAYVTKDELVKPNCIKDQPVCLPWWFRGCSSVGKPHKALEERMREWGYHAETMVNKVKVPSITYGTLLRKYNVSSIGYLRIDIEGMDFMLLQQVFAHGQEAGTWPETIQFEQQGSVSMWNQIRFQFHQKYECWTTDGEHVNHGCILRPEFSIGPRQRNDLWGSHAELYATGRRCCPSESCSPLHMPKVFLSIERTAYCGRKCVENSRCKFFTTAEDFLCFLADACEVDVSVVFADEQRFLVRTYTIPSRLTDTVYVKGPLWSPTWAASASSVYLSAKYLQRPTDVMRPPHFPVMPQYSLGTSIYEYNCFATQEDDALDVYWLADLTRRVKIDAVRVTIPQGNVTTWALRIGEGPAWRAMRFCGLVSSGYGSVRKTVHCDGIIGRYVVIAVPDGGMPNVIAEQRVSLQLCNVEIFGSFVGN